MGSGGEGSTLGDVPFYLVEPNKSVEHAPTRIHVGGVRLHSWQIHPVEPLPADFAGSAAYLIKVNYEFRLEPGVPPPSRAGIRFEFGARSAVVSDALPRTVERFEAARGYRLTPHLGFVPADGPATGGPWPPGAVAGHLAVPALVPWIGCTGVGGASIGWRHERTAARHLCDVTHSGWLALLVPARCRRVPVLATGEFGLGTATPPGLGPVARADAFAVRLRPPAGRPGRSGPPPASPPGSPRVFITYAHDTPAHKVAVRRFCEFLRGLDIDVRYDQDGLETRRSWTDWSNAQITRADFVIAVASPAYRRVGQGTAEPGARRGIISEYGRLVDELHRDRQQWIKKILPVVLPGRSVDEIPRDFLPYTADHYIVDELTEEGAKDLLSVLRAHRSARPAQTGNDADAPS